MGSVARGGLIAEPAADDSTQSWEYVSARVHVCGCVCVGGRGPLRREVVYRMRDAGCAKRDVRCGWVGGILLSVGGIDSVLRVGSIVGRLGSAAFSVGSGSAASLVGP